MDIKEPLPEQYRSLYDSILKAVWSKSDVFDKECPIYAGVITGRGGNPTNVYDCYYFYHWVNAVQHYQQAAFMKALEDEGIGDKQWKNKTAWRGFTNKYLAKKAFEISAEFRGNTIQQHLCGYLQSIKGIKIRLHGIKGHEQTIQKLFENTPVFAKNENFIPPEPEVNNTEVDIFAAAAEGNLDLISEEISTGFDINQSRKYDGATLLHVAISNEHLDTVVYLLKNGAINDVVDFDGITPLEEAANVNPLGLNSPLLAAIDIVLQ